VEVCRRGDGGCSGSTSAMGHRVKRTTCQTAQSKSESREMITLIRRPREKDWMRNHVLTQRHDRTSRLQNGKIRIVQGKFTLTIFQTTQSV